MSVNITVNGKYTNSCLRHNLLNDPEQVRKNTENERRKMRIQQVRTASKNLAAKVRNNVETEKERQLKKIEEIKALEMETWRQTVAAQKESDFRSAIFQVGTAHRAARVENAKQVKQKPRPPFKRFKNLNVTSNIGKENVLKNANVQTDISAIYCKKPETSLDNKNALNACSKRMTDNITDFEKECEEEISTFFSTTISSDVLQSSTSSLSDSDEIAAHEKAKSARPISKLKKNLPVLIEIQHESDTSLVDLPNVEDHRTQSNRHSSKVISKQQTPKKQTSKYINKNQEKRSATIVEPVPSTSAGAKKRFTQISDIIRQQKSSDECIALPLDPPQQNVMQKSPPKPQSKSPITGSRQYATSRLHRSPTKLSLHTADTLATKSSSSAQSLRSSTARVQFYDYNNKFQKQYDQPASVVEVHEPSAERLQMNAMEQAQLEARLREARELEMEKLRQKSAERCQKAVEKEQVRRACEDLTAKLDALTKQRPVLPSDNYQFSSLRLGQVNVEKEIKLNSAVENILRRPAVITCPVVNRQDISPTTTSNDALRSHANDLNLGLGFTADDMNNLNSSDSCCSILLGYVNGQSKQIADDIKRYNKQNDDSDKEKAEKLKHLLTRINRLREGLISELEKCSMSTTTNKERVQTMMNSISEFRKEREQILIDSNTKDSILKRESDLKKKEAILEKKLREFYEIQKQTKKKDKAKVVENGDKQSDVPSDRSKKTNKDPREDKANGDTCRVQERESLKIHKDAPHRVKTKEKIVCEESNNQSLSSEGDSYEELLERKNLLIGEKPLEIVIKLKSGSKSRKPKKLPSKSPRKLCTLIQSPTPKKSKKKLSVAQSNESGSTSYRSLPPTIHNNVDKLLKNVPSKAATDSQAKLQRKEENKHQLKQSSNLNPLMAHYVQRLLGMSRTSIKALEVSSSDIDTPSNSIINITANLSAAETERLASNRLEHIQKFLEDNYSFIGQLEESLRHSNSTDSSLKTVEVWKKALQDKTSQKPTKSALKKSSTRQTQHDSVEKQNTQETQKIDVEKLHTKQDSMKKVPSKPIQKDSVEKLPANQTKHDTFEKQKTAFVDKSTQLTDDCTQRIAELTEMINKVRKEKQKILETTLSSVSDNGPNSTEYLDLPDRRNHSGESTVRNMDTQFVKSAEMSPETEPQLEKHKSIGMSRDSGISVSRPITVQELRESTTEELLQVQSSIESLSFKKPKPPISISRYSPQLVEDIPHELSTIFEVDTPATSRINTSIQANNGQELTVPPLQNDDAEKITYKKFHTFEEYARIHQLDMSQFDPEFSMQLEKEFNEFISLAKEGKVNGYEEFTSFSKYFTKCSSGEDKDAAEDLLASLKIANMSFRKFPTRKEYLDKIGVSTSDLLDSRSLDKAESDDSSTSLINIEEELKLRKILTKSFRHQPQHDDKNLSTTSTSVSPRKAPENNGDISGIRQLTTSADDQSDQFDNYLKQLGINWPSMMRRKTKETQALSSSTSSSIVAAPTISRKKPTKQSVEKSFQKEIHETTTQTEEGGRQLNLQEFIKKELLKQTASTTCSFSEDSLASSILRSIIDSMTPTPPQQANGAGAGLDRHKTSTPMASQSTSSGKVASRSQGGVSLFSGESRLSSVHFNNSSRDANQNAMRDLETDSFKKL